MRVTKGISEKRPVKSVECRVVMIGFVKGLSLSRLRNLNRRIARLERFALLVSVDSLGSLSASQNATLWHRFPRSPIK